jgi:hypothetical protein
MTETETERTTARSALAKLTCELESFAARLHNSGIIASMRTLPGFKEAERETARVTAESYTKVCTMIGGGSGPPFRGTQRFAALGALTVSLLELAESKIPF